MPRDQPSAPDIQLTTDAEGLVHLPLASAGLWSVKFAKMGPSTVDGINYESQRATLTFQVR